MANAALRAVLGQRGPSRRYIYDRCNGSSVYQGESRRPCCYMCFVPPPVVVWPDTCEQNSPCESLGRLGCIRANDQKARSGIFTALLLFNFYALALVVFATFAGSDTTDVLSKANFAEGSVFVQTGDAVVPVRAYVGLVNVAMKDPSGIILGTATAEGERVYSWDEFCGNFTGNATSIAAFSDMSSCQTCADTSDNVQRLLILTILNYDVNCQKVWALLATAAALVCTAWGWYSLDRDCFRVLFRPDPEPTVAATARVSWEAGSGLICLFCASVLKFLDFLGHLLVPTPTICYDHVERDEYEDKHRTLQSIQLPQHLHQAEKEEEDRPMVV